MNFVIYSGKKIKCQSNRLDLSNLGIQKISEVKGLTNLTDLETLNLSHNKIQNISDLENLENLRVLKIDHNHISKIEGLDSLRQLKVLDLSYNDISEVSGIYHLLELKRLNLRDNNVAHIPNLLNYLPKLTKINLASNKIKFFPKSLTHYVIMAEFKINKYITLRLENYETIIYIQDRRFNVCKYLLLHIPMDNITEYDLLDSIDEAAEKLDRSLEYPAENQIKIMPYTEFWGHCSNLQVWAENNYDSRLLHRNLAFPLLKKLADVGDQTANRVFKEEIAKRIINGNFTVFLYLLKQGYLSYLTKDEIKFILDDPNSKFFDNFITSLKTGRTAFKKAIIDVFMKLYQVNPEFLRKAITELNKKNQIRLLLFFSLNNNIDVTQLNSEEEKVGEPTILKEIISNYLIENLNYALNSENIVLKQTALRFLLKFYYFIPNKKLFQIFNSLTPERRRSIIELLIHEHYDPFYENVPYEKKHSCLPLSIKFELIRILIRTYNLKGTPDDVLYHLDILYPTLHRHLIVFLMSRLNKQAFHSFRNRSNDQRLVEDINTYLSNVLNFCLQNKDQTNLITLIRYFVIHFESINKNTLIQSFNKLSTPIKKEILQIILDEHRNPQSFKLMQNAYKVIELLGISYSTIESIIRNYELYSKRETVFNISKFLNNRETVLKSMLFLIIELQFAKEKELKKQQDINTIFKFLNSYIVETLIYGLKNEKDHLFRAIINFLIKFFPYIQPEDIFRVFTSLSSESMLTVKRTIESYRTIYNSPHLKENINDLLKIIRPDDYFHFYI